VSAKVFLQNDRCVVGVGGRKWEVLLWDIALSEAAVLASGSAHARATRLQMIL
jgi:hypothetical protein